MTIENWERIQDLFLAAADLAGEERARFLDAQFGGDLALRREVESLLAADRKTGEEVIAAVEAEARRVQGRALRKNPLRQPKARRAPLNHLRFPPPRPIPRRQAPGLLAGRRRYTRRRVEVGRSLVLNATFQPLAVVPSRRAVVLVLKEKAEIVVSNGVIFRSEHVHIAAPTVVRRAQRGPRHHLG